MIKLFPAWERERARPHLSSSPPSLLLTAEPEPLRVRKLIRKTLRLSVCRGLLAQWSRNKQEWNWNIQVESLKINKQIFLLFIKQRKERELSQFRSFSLLTETMKMTIINFCETDICWKVQAFKNYDYHFVPLTSIVCYKKEAEKFSQHGDRGNGQTECSHPTPWEWTSI